MWVDPNLNEFYSRVARIEKAHAKGYGFEATGTLGRRAAQGRTVTRRLRLLRPLVLMLAFGLGLKGVIHSHIGAATYESRVSALAAGTGFDPVGAWLMYPDPVTLYISRQLQSYIPR